MRSAILVGFFAAYTLLAQGWAAQPAFAEAPGILRLVSGMNPFSNVGFGRVWHNE